jgi:penicillin-binding protein 2
MPQRVPERLPPITPQLAWRVAVLGGLAFVLFGIVFFRLWFLQVLSGQDYVSIARENRVRKVRIEAPRGDIVDTNGVRLVTTKPAAVVQMLPNDLPDSVKEQADQYRKDLAAAAGEAQQAEARYKGLRAQLDDEPGKDTKDEKRTLRYLKKLETPRKVAVPKLPATEQALAKLYRRISRVLGDVSAGTIHRRVIRGLADAAYSNVTIKTDVGTAEFNYIRENPELFPGVVVEKRFLRLYPKKDEAAQLYGTVSEITEDQRNGGLKRYAGIAQGTRIGQSGLEERYDKYLRGRDGYTNVVVNAMGTRDDQRKASVRNYVQGQRLRLTIDSNLEKAGDEALKQGIAHAAQNGATAGAYVAMDPTNGAILAMGSQPSFDANVFARPFSQKDYDSLISDRTSAPLLDRATESGYPTGSVFKPVTALAALETGLISPTYKYNDTGEFEYGNPPQHYQNAKKAVNGPVDMSDAIMKSSDTYFFRLGSLATGGTAIQRWARKLGFGRTTGLDVPGEKAGLVPDPTWRNRAYSKYAACAKKNHLPERTTQALFKCGGIERQWVGGDNVNLAVGQGDLQATPLQVAVAYSALANGGTIVRPHVGAAIEDGQGGDVEEFSVRPRRKVKINANDLQVVRDGLRRAAQEPGGTSHDVFKGWNMQEHPVYGKTGTAQRGNDPDQAWYACWVMDKNRPIVVVVTIEKGGFGADTAAPAARLILDQWFATGDHEFHAGVSETN